MVPFNKELKTVCVLASAVLKLLVDSVGAKAESVDTTASNRVFCGSLLDVQWNVTDDIPTSEVTKAMGEGALAKVAVATKADQVLSGPEP